MEIYGREFSVEVKEDNSPLTEADQASHNIIVAELEALNLGIPILSEESKGITYEKRKDWTSFWCVDPLDGTKEFIKRNGEFTVNIALVENGKPTLWVIYVPVQKVFYYAVKWKGSFKKDAHWIQKLPLMQRKKSDLRLTVVASRSHSSEEMESFVEELRKKYAELEYVSAGSSLKFCLVAEGKADMYPRLVPTMEWDTAAGQVIAEEAGCDVKIYWSEESLEYNKENLLNPYFVVA